MFSPSLPSNTTHRYSRGFGLIELMVSISIMAIIMAVVITRHDSFNGAVLLRSQAYEIALQLREVQLSAVSATSRAGEYRSNLGVYFAANTPNRYTVFQDGTSGVDGRYDNGEQLGIAGALDPRFEIRSIRRADNTSLTIPNVSVVFARPDFDADFSSTAALPAGLPGIIIEVGRVGTSGTGVGEARYVEITATGQITVRTADELGI